MPALLEIDGLEVTFAGETGEVAAVRGVSLEVDRGEMVALVGESGSGKSVTALAVLRLLPEPPARITGGRILFDGVDLLRLGEEPMRRLRGRRIGMIFQEPMTSLNPLLSVGRQLTEAMEVHLGISRRQAERRAVELLEAVGIPDPEGRLRQYPHQLSGGMRQRVMIAIALCCEPDLVIADEPTTALDVTIQAQILEVMQDLCARLGVALLLITHNLAIVARYAHRVNVMYAGRVVESGEAVALYRRPAHPYTLGLLESVPRLDRPRGAPLEPIPGSPPDPAALPSGCAFRPRCRLAQPRCAEAVPDPVPIEPGHRSACFEYRRLRAEAPA